MNIITVDEAVKEFKEEFNSYKKDVSKNHGDAYDPEMLNMDLEAYKLFVETDMFNAILAL